MSNKAQRIITVKHRYGWTMAGTLVCIARHLKKTDLDAEFSVVKDGRVHKIGSARNPSVLKLLGVEEKKAISLRFSPRGPMPRKLWRFSKPWPTSAPRPGSEAAASCRGSKTRDGTIVYLCGVECTVATHVGREQEEVNHGVS